MKKFEDELVVIVKPLIADTTEESLFNAYTEYRGIQRINVSFCKEANLKDLKQAEFVFKEARDVAVWVQEVETGCNPMQSFIADMNLLQLVYPNSIINTMRKNNLKTKMNKIRENYEQKVGVLANNPMEQNDNNFMNNQSNNYRGNDHHQGGYNNRRGGYQRGRGGRGFYNQGSDFNNNNNNNMQGMLSPQQFVQMNMMMQAMNPGFNGQMLPPNLLNNMSNMKNQHHGFQENQGHSFNNRNFNQNNRHFSNNNDRHRGNYQNRDQNQGYHQNQGHRDQNQYHHQNQHHQNQHFQNPHHQNQQQFSGNQGGFSGQDVQENSQFNQSTQNENQNNEINWNLENILNNTQVFEALNPDVQRNILGKIMYQRIEQVNPSIPQEYTSKVTAILIDFETFSVTEILDIITNDDELTKNIQEAIELIQEQN